MRHGKSFVTTSDGMSDAPEPGCASLGLCKRHSPKWGFGARINHRHCPDSFLPSSFILAGCSYRREEADSPALVVGLHSQSCRQPVVFVAFGQHALTSFYTDAHPTRQSHP
ncbi:MAG: hypothetical protein JWM16_4329 [Verrucomicrobiales bacterium]|nr:hypothetical protein [Verrucomicrobiales bacterium]